MQKFVKIIFRDAKRMEPLYLSLEKWEGILTDPKTLVPYKLDGEEAWTGRTLNKAEVIEAVPDDEFSERYAKRNLRPYKHIASGRVTMLDPAALPERIGEYEKL